MRNIVILEEDEMTTLAGGVLTGHRVSHEADLVLRRRTHYTYEILKDRHGDGRDIVDSLPTRPTTREA